MNKWILPRQPLALLLLLPLLSLLLLNGCTARQSALQDSLAPSAGNMVQTASGIPTAQSTPDSGKAPVATAQSSVLAFDSPAGAVLRRNKNPSLPFFTVAPTSGVVSSRYGMRALGSKKSARLHSGIDVNTQRGTPVVASGAGKVVFVGRKAAYGKIVEIDHGNGVLTRYAHLDTYSVASGTSIRAGQQLGRAGRTGRTTGVNLHFEVLVDGNHKDPLKFLPSIPALPTAVGASQGADAS